MTNVITCPYCQNKMEIRELGFKAKIVFYECPHCLSRSPQTYNVVTANSMARMPQKRRLKAVHDDE